MLSRMLGKRSHSRGQALVEFALIAFPLMMVICGTFDLGRAVFTNNTLAEAVRQGDRVAIVNQDVNMIKQAVVNYSPTLGLKSSDVSVCFAPAGSTVTACDQAGAKDCSLNPQLGCLAIVSAKVEYHPITPLIGPFIPDGFFKLSSTSFGPVENLCPTQTKATCP